MRIDLEFVELHAPLFVDGINYGLKLYSDPKKAKSPIEMYYDTELKHTVIICKAKVALIENSASMTLSNPKQIGVDISMTPAPLMARPTIVRPTEIKAQVSGPERVLHNAQVESPISHPPRKPGRPAKYQGEEPT